MKECVIQKMLRERERFVVKKVDIDDRLVEAARRLTGEQDDRAAVERVLERALDVRQKNAALLDLVGKVEFHEGYDPRNSRSLPQ